MKYIFNLFIIYIFSITFFIPIDSHSQSQANFLFRKIKDQKIQIKGFDDYYVDFTRNSIIDVSQGREETFDFVGDTYTGSFLNANKKEYILIVKLAKDQYCSFFSRADNGGKTTMIFTFDDKYEQIGKVGFQDYQSEYADAIDIDNDGITELIMKSSYGSQGCNYKWWMIFRKDFNEPLLKLTNYQSCEDSGMRGDIIRLNSKYKVDNGKFIVESKLELLYREDDMSELKLLKTDNRLDVYECKTGGIVHLPGDNNIKWDENDMPY